MQANRTNIILEVIYKMSLSPNFINSPDAIKQYIITINQAYDQADEPISTNNDLIKLLQNFDEFPDIIPPFKYPFPDDFVGGVKFIQIPIKSDGNCLFSCLAYLDKWKGLSHIRVREMICDHLGEVINKLRDNSELTSSNPETNYEDFPVFYSSLYPNSAFSFLCLLLDYSPPLVESFIKDSTNQLYITEMRKPNAWGAGIEILTAIFITQQDINVYAINTNNDKSIGILQELFTDIKNHLIKFGYINIDTKQEPLNIYFCGGKHYELLQPKNAMTYLKKPDILRPEKEREQIFKTAEGILKKGHTDPNIINTMHKAAALEVSSAQLEVSSAQLTKEYICIPNPKGQFSSRLDCESNTVSIKQDPAQLKTEVINEVLNQIIGKLYNGYDFLSDPSLIDTYKHKLQQLYDKKLKLYTRYDYLDFKSFMDILKEDDFFKDKIILVETHSPPYAYKYMKYKIKYLTLKNNTYYNKYL